MDVGCAKTHVSLTWNLYGTIWNNEGKPREEAKDADTEQIIMVPHKSCLGFEFHPQLSNWKLVKNCEMEK